MAGNQVGPHVESFDVGEDATQSLKMLDDNIRAGFVRKVYGILSVQLAVTVVIAFPIQQMDPYWIATHQQFCQAAMLISLGAVIGVSCCCQQVARKYPQNYVFLAIVTICEAIVVGFISAMYTTPSVLMAAGLTGGIFSCLTAYAIYTKTDFTGMGMYLMVALCGLSLTGFLCIFFPYSPTVQKIMAGFGAILFSFYIVYDTQLICGGNHKKHQFGVDDYVFAALTIYLDIINLFIYLLSLFGERR